MAAVLPGDEQPILAAEGDRPIVCHSLHPAASGHRARRRPTSSLRSSSLKSNRSDEKAVIGAALSDALVSAPYIRPATKLPNAHRSAFQAL
jgi:hypothetical protein